MDWLLFDLAGPLASFGSVAPGQVRDTELLPSRSAILGLLAASLGIERVDSEQQQALSDSVTFAARANANATLQRDYHTAQAPKQPALKGRPCRTRRDELRVPKDDLNTVLSDRYYFADYAAVIGISASLEVLHRLEEALKRPKFTLFLGRKSCPLAWPLDPHQLHAPTWAQALQAHDQRSNEKLANFDKAILLKWLRGNNFVYSADSHVLPGDLGGNTRSVIRWDQPTDTARRLYAARSHWRADTREAR